MNERRAIAVTYALEGAWIVVAALLAASTLSADPDAALTVGWLGVLAVLLGRMLWLGRLRAGRYGDLGAPTTYARRGASRAELVLTILTVLAFAAIVFLREDGAITTTGVLVGAALFAVVGVVRITEFRRVLHSATARGSTNRNP